MIFISYMWGAIIVAIVSYYILRTSHKKEDQPWDITEMLSSVLLGIIWPIAFAHILYKSFKRDYK